MMVGCVKDFFTYQTNKSVVVKSWTIGIINRVVQLLIIAYFIGWVFMHEKAYQTRDSAIESSVMTKVKGFGSLNDHIMDVADYVTPTQGASMFCLITKIIATENQVQGKCPEFTSPKERKYICVNDSQCEEGKSANTGVLTGRCIPFGEKNKSCEVKGWCPAENDGVVIKPMMEVQNFTIFIKNSIRFPLFNFTKGNFLPNISKEHIGKCNFDPDHDKFCPIFKVGDVLRFAHQNFTTLAHKGGVIGIKIGWVCDLDRSDDECIPSYSFTRLDAMSQGSSVSPGYNFRFAKYYKMENGTEYRTLLKAYAIRFDVLVYGNAGKFDMIPTLINMVAAFTSVGVGTVLCDIILLNFLKGADQYKAKKFEEVTEAEVQRSSSLVEGMYRTREHSELSVRLDEKQSGDSGAFSLVRYD
ncbi:P2X purinoceptor 3b [Engraulis encrasicolus]|uniref:P2X purinoceptor 3b n=1 Tax=Engraulis encrasicolus TaxID=184585 RepID=UPI002FD631BB